MQVALDEATHSPDQSTQNGAVVVTEAGYVADCNRFPNGVSDLEERWERPGKYDWVEHAERNAIYLAAKNGLALDGATMVAVWASCADCARAIVQAGIKKLVRGPADHGKQNWSDSISVGDIILKEGGVEIVEMGMEGLDLPALLRNGQPWSGGI